MENRVELTDFLTIGEAAERLGIAHSGVARYVRQGRLPHARKGRQKLIPERAVAEFTPRPAGRPMARREKVA